MLYPQTSFLYCAFRTLFSKVMVSQTSILLLQYWFRSVFAGLTKDDWGLTTLTNNFSASHKKWFWISNRSTWNWAKGISSSDWSHEFFNRGKSPKTELLSSADHTCKLCFFSVSREPHCHSQYQCQSSSACIKLKKEDTLHGPKHL